MRCMKGWSVLATTLILFAPYARAAAQQSVEPSGPVVIPQSESFTLGGGPGETPYRISVALPSGYGEDLDERYPVLYAVDADAGFASLVDVTRFLALSGETPKVIVVGIGYGTDLATWRRRRGVDLKPQLQAEPGRPGGASRFLDFITGEVIPSVEGRYRCAEGRTFFGYSLGGLFGTWVLFHRPGIFHHYILGSPSYGWAGGVALKWPSEVDGAGPAPTGEVFTSVGTEESEAMIGNWQTFWEATEALDIPGLRIVRGTIDETHAGAVWHTLVKGVKAVLR